MLEYIGASQRNGELASLVSRKSGFWPDILESTFYSEPVERLAADLLEECHRQNEFEMISIDGHVKACLPHLGQANRLATKKIKSDMPLRDKETLNTVLTVKTITGAVAMMQPCHTESTEAYIETMKKHLKPRWYVRRVKHVATDDPSRKMLLGFQELVQDGNVTLSLDPIHLAFKWDSVTVSLSAKPRGSAAMHKIVSKFNAKSRPSRNKLRDGFYCGIERTSEEINVEAVFGAMTKKKAEDILKSLNPEVAYGSRKEFVDALAALAAFYKDTALKKTASGRTLNQILVSACAPDRFEWAMNWTRFIAGQSRLAVPVSTGTTGNEALRAQL